MEETNNKTNPDFTPVNLNRKTPPYFLLSAVVVLIIGILAYLAFFQKGIPFKFRPEKTATPEEIAKVIIKTKAYELANEKGVQIYFSSSNVTVEVPAFQIEFLLPEGSKKENIIIKTNSQLETQGWKFPIARFDEEGNQPVIKIAGYRLGNSPFEIKGNLLLATITTKDKTNLTLTVNKENTLLYSSDAVTKIPFDTQSE